MQSLDGKIARIKFHKQSKWNGLMYLIAELDNGETVKGNMDSPVEGMPYRFWGEKKAQKGGYGDAFEFETVEPICDRSTGGMVDYLSAHINGIGRKKARDLVEAFGGETLTILRETPERATEVEGISPAIAAAIRNHFESSAALDPIAYACLVEMFADYKIGKRIVERLVRTFGSAAPDRVRANPYLLLDYPRTGWKTVDALALTECSYDPEGVDRHRAAIRESLERIASDGHTCATGTDILDAADKLLGCHLDRSVLNDLVAEGSVVETRDEFGPIYQLASLAEAEKTIAEKLAVLMAAGRPLPAPLATEEWLAESRLGDDDQARAVKMIEENAVVILAGPPGTGKTYTLSRVLGRLRQIGLVSIRVMAPTGKASKRAAELLYQVAGCGGIPCTTVHKALAPSPNVESNKAAKADARFGRGREEFAFGKDEAHPFDEHVLVIDEGSMIDVRLFANVVRAIKPGTRLIIVGDWNQLPSVGPGSVLRDIRGLIPTAELTRIRRSDGGGTVVRACHAIKDGRVPEDADALDLPTKNWIHLEIDDPDEIASKIVDLHATTRRFDPILDMQVVSAQKGKHAFGCDNLNRLLSELLNPGHASGREGRDEEGGPPFRIGDKIVRTKNGLADEMIEWRRSEEYDAGYDDSRPDLYWQDRGYKVHEIPIVNGDMGQVLDITEEARPSVIVQFRDPDRLVRLPYSDCHLIPAYAMTVHKMQGSGAKYIIIPAHKAFYHGLFTRELFYTALSRTEIVCVTVGQWSSIVAAIGRQSIHLRKTTLARRLDEAITNTPRPGEIPADVRLSLAPSGATPYDEAMQNEIDMIDFARNMPALAAPEPVTLAIEEPWEVVAPDDDDDEWMIRRLPRQLVRRS